MIIGTFNLKNGTLDIFNKRIKGCAKLIRSNNFDIIGVQELTLKSKHILELELPEYEFLGESRGSIGFTDEFNSILIKNNSFDEISTRTYSLSKDIYKKGSRLPLDSFPRICTVVHFRKGLNNYLIVNTHLDNVFPFNRRKQLKILENIIKIERRNDESLIVMGDFNMSLNDYLNEFLINNGLKDVVDASYGSTIRNALFRRPIDHIFISNDLISLCVSLVKDYDIKLSDHYPIMTLVRK